MGDKCVFCNKKYRIVYESDNFIVSIGLGIITPGHVMLIPKKHMACLAELPKQLISEFEEVKKRVVKAITKEFSEPFMVEYGVWFQSVHHAHLHFIPKKSQDYKIKNIIKEMFELDKLDIEPVDFIKLKEIYKKESKYVLVEENGQMYVCHLNDIKEKDYPANLCFRVFFTDIKGLKGVRDWNKMSKREKETDNMKIEETKKKLMGKI